MPNTDFTKSRTGITTEAARPLPPSATTPSSPNPVATKPLDTEAAAEIVGLAPKTLIKMRCYGGGPVFEKNGRRVLYDLDDLLAWRRQNKRRSTSDPGPGAA